MCTPIWGTWTERGGKWAMIVASVPVTLLQPHLKPWEGSILPAIVAAISQESRRRIWYVGVYVRISWFLSVLVATFLTLLTFYGRSIVRWMLTANNMVSNFSPEGMTVCFRNVYIQLFVNTISCASSLSQSNPSTASDLLVLVIGIICPKMLHDSPRKCSISVVSPDGGTSMCQVW